MTDEELNQAVATEVMGWIPQDGGFWRKPNYTSVTKRNFLSDDWSGVRLVVERMEKLGYRFEMRKYKGSAEAVFIPDYSDVIPESEDYADAFTVPRATCLAALKAVGGGE